MGVPIVTAAERALFADEDGEPDPRAEFRALLRIHRATRGWGLRRTAKRAALHWSLISRLESGERNPTREAVAALADALDLDGAQTERLTVAAGFVPAGYQADEVARDDADARDEGAAGLVAWVEGCGYLPPVGEGGLGAPFASWDEVLAGYRGYVRAVTEGGEALGG